MTRSRLLWMCVFAGVLTLCGLDDRAQAQGPERAAVDHAKRIFDLIKSEQFDAVVKEFDGQMSAALSPAQMREVWSSLRMQFGASTSLLDERVTTSLNPPSPEVLCSH